MIDCSRAGLMGEVGPCEIYQTIDAEWRIYESVN